MTCGEGGGYRGNDDRLLLFITVNFITLAQHSQHSLDCYILPHYHSCDNDNARMLSGDDRGGAMLHLSKLSNLE